MAFIWIYGTDPSYLPALADVYADGSVDIAYLYGTSVPGSPWYMWSHRQYAGDPINRAYPPPGWVNPVLNPVPGAEIPSQPPEVPPEQTLPPLPSTILRNSKPLLYVAGGTVAALVLVAALRRR